MDWNRKKNNWIFICIIGLLVSGVSAMDVQAAIYKQLTAVQCDSLIKANATNPDFVIMDVRTPGEYNPDHIEGAINRDYYNNFSTAIALLNKQKIYLIHCASGTRSAGAFSSMKTQQFGEVYEMKSGINAWKGAGFYTTAAFTPKLMIATKNIEAWKVVKTGTTDTITVRLTNHGNSLLQFLTVTDLAHPEFSTDFKLLQTLNGAEDYTFRIFFKPGDLQEHSFKYAITSNGGSAEFTINRREEKSTNLPFLMVPEIVLYPNPAHEKVTFRNLPAGTDILYRITEISGNTLQSGRLKDNTVDVSKIKPGNYVLQLKTGQSDKAFKIVVN